jgi:hypothetical protein
VQKLEGRMKNAKPLGELESRFEELRDHDIDPETGWMEDKEPQTEVPR